MNSRIRAAVTGVALYVLGSLPASAGMMTYDFYNITNTETDLSGQLSITMWSWDEANATFGGNANYMTLTSNDIFFTVQNNVGIASNVAEVYFDDGFFGDSMIMNSLGGYTMFTGGGANPGNLPGGSMVGFQATQQFSADVDPGPPNKGVDQSADILGIYMELGTYADFAAAAEAVYSGDLQFGLHVRSIGGGSGSDSYVSNPGDDPSPDPDPPPGVPVPGTLLLMGLGLLLLAARTRQLR